MNLRKNVRRVLVQLVITGFLLTITVPEALARGSSLLAGMIVMVCVFNTVFLFAKAEGAK
jgi:hypothetical protein